MVDESIQFSLRLWKHAYRYFFIYFVDEELFAACNGRRPGMRARMNQEGKWKRTQDVILIKQPKSKDPERESKKKRKKHSHDKNKKHKV